MSSANHLHHLHRRLRRRLVALALAAALAVAGALAATAPAHADANVQITGPASPVTVNTPYTYNVTTLGAVFTDFYTATVSLSGAPATFTGYSSTGAEVCTLSGAQASCQSGPGGNGTITLTVLPTATGTVTASVSETSGQGNGSDSTTTTIIPPAAADLSVALAADGDPGLLAGHITYAVTVTNLGPAALASATITAPLPTPMTATSSDCATSSGNVVTCTLGALAPGASVTDRFTVPVGLLTLNHAYTVTATRTASTPADPNPANDSATRTCTILTSLIISCH